MDTQTQSDILSNFGFFCIMIAYMINANTKTRIFRIFLIIGNTIIVLWASIFLNFRDSLSLIIWSSLFVITNIYRYYEFIKSPAYKNNNNKKTICYEFKNIYKDILEFITCGFYKFPTTETDC